ncbi:hypothetical protein NL676_024104 [Syzygium grande]|nr:hypothetical protein NL676_024104 [Syzygium grande]
MSGSTCEQMVLLAAAAFEGCRGPTAIISLGIHRTDFFSLWGEVTLCGVVGWWGWLLLRYARARARPVAARKARAPPSRVAPRKRAPPHGLSRHQWAVGGRARPLSAAGCINFGASREPRCDAGFVPRTYPTPTCDNGKNSGGGE